MHPNILAPRMLLLVAALLASPAGAGPVTGDIAAAGCAGCHGASGQGNAEMGFPALAQLPVPYFTKQLADFRAGTRTTVQPLTHHDFKAAADYTYYVRFMRAAASGVSASDAKALGSYYAAQARAKVPAPNVPPEVVARGKTIATNGAWDRQVPPCFKCHATNGVGVPPSFPPIAGQHAAYTARQLMAWKKGDRANDPQKLMAFTAQQLTDEEIQAVAAYLATLELSPRKASK
ncbi:MAG: c-type cytochrome [Thiobacillus sp.]